MEPQKAHKLARQLMHEHELQDWVFRYNESKSNFGTCRHRLWFAGGIIELSKILVRLNNEARVRNTILHEIAHAILGPSHDHDYTWYKKAIEIGCDGKIYYGAGVLRPKPAYIGTCKAGHTAEVYSLSQTREKQEACGICCREQNNGRYSVDHLFTWQKNN